MSPSIRNQAKLASVALAAGLAWTALTTGDAQAQGLVVHEFTCTSSPFGVSVDVRGLGNQNVCIEGDVTIDANCACVGGGGNCPRDAQKQTTTVEAQASETVEAKNGRVNTTFTLPVAFNDGLCGTGTLPLTCPSGQEAKLITWEAGDGANFTLCTSDEPAGEDCSCLGQEILATQTCGPTSDIVFEGRRGNCLALFP